MKYLSYFIMIFLFTNCIKREETNNTFIVPMPKKPIEKSTKSNWLDPPDPPPLKPYYAPFNFIVDSSGEISYYQMKLYGNRCRNGLNWDSPPPYINLLPKDIIYLPDYQLEDFMKINIFVLDPVDRYISVASIKDTIQSAGLSKIFTILNNPSNHAKWWFRSATQEERIVLDFKKNKQIYVAESIQWDSAKNSNPPH